MNGKSFTELVVMALYNVVCIVMYSFVDIGDKLNKTPNHITASMTVPVLRDR